MWIESQDKNHLVDVDRIHKHREKHVEYSRVIFPDLLIPVEIKEKITYTYQILDENGLVLGEYSTEEQLNEVWETLINFVGVWDVYSMPEDKKEVSEDEKTCN